MAIEGDAARQPTWRVALRGIGTAAGLMALAVLFGLLSFLLPGLVRHLIFYSLALFMVSYRIARPDSIRREPLWFGFWVVLLVFEALFVAEDLGWLP
jgi:hypothetical protein